jgi:hypothetical protein
VHLETSTKPHVHRKFKIFWTNIASTMACPNFKKAWKMASSPLGVNWPLKEQGTQNGLFALWVGCCEHNMFVDFLNFLSVVDMDGSFPMRCYTQSLDLRFKSYEIFKISDNLWACYQPLPMQQICSKLPKIAKNCQNMSKDETLKYYQKLRF